MNIVLYGDEKLLLKQKLESLKKQYHVSTEEMNLSTYYMSDASMNDVLDDAMMVPFLSEYKMVVMKEPLFLTSLKQKNVTEAQVKAFMDYLEHDNPSTILVVYHDEHNFDERKKVTKALRKHAQFFEIRKLTDQQLYKTTRKAIQARGSKIDDDALALLLERTGNDLLLVSQEVEKICLYSDHIRRQDVDRLVTPQLEERIYTLTNAIVQHDMDQVFKIYHDLITNKQEPIMLIGAIANSFRQLYQVKMLVRHGYTDQEITRTMNINPRAVYPIRKNAERFELNDLKTYLKSLSDLDRKIKMGLIDKKKGLELFLLEITNHDH